MKLGKLYNKYGCDKSSKHSYDLIYQKYFEPVREERIKILELGVFKGASMKAHQEYFPNAIVHGLDIFERVSIDAVDVDLDRGALFEGSSQDKEAPAFIRNEFKNIKYDFIIDDAQHTPEANRKTFEIFSRMMKKTGVYFIEDVWPMDIMTKEELNHPWLNKHASDYTSEKFDKFLDSLKGFDVTRYDNRAISGHPDSYIMAIKNA
jgi:hypothetical protein